MEAIAKGGARAVTFLLVVAAALAGICAAREVEKAVRDEIIVGTDLFAAELDAIDKSWGDRLNATTELGTAPANETSEPPSTSSPAELHEAVDFLLALDATKGQREEGLVRR